MIKTSLVLSANRAYRAKYNRLIGNKWFLISLKVVFLSSFFAGLGLLLRDNALGWLVLMLFSSSLMLLAWWKGSLSNTSFGVIQKSGQIQLHEALEFEPLTQLHTTTPSAFEVWEALKNSEERYFIGNRYLIDSNYFEQLLDKTPDSATSIWEVVDGYRVKYELSGYTNMAVLVALVASVPSHDQILTSVRLGIKDVETAIPWMRDILEKRRLIREQKNFGGIGRDWAFGYTPILRYMGQNISESIQIHGFFSDTSMHKEVVTNMIQTMNNGNGTVTLVGETGVGKTTCVHAFAEQLLTDSRAPKYIRYNQVVELDAPTLIANAKNHGQLEELMLRILKEAQRAKNIILFFDDAEAFFGSGPGSVDLSHILQPALESHSVRLVLAMSPQAWQRLAGTSVSARLQPITVSPADETNTLSVLRDSISLAEYKSKVVFTYQALQEAYKLGTRYVTNQAMPGAALSILEQSAVTAQQPLITREAVQASVEQTYGIKLQTASGGSESAKLLSLEQELHKYVINQNRAVTVVSDALRRSRSGVGNPNRPVGTFLFLGPTGVGKTELSKALARVYFNDETALIRVDMNQYVQASAVERLIQPMAGSELGFLGQVRKNPFSVILLDEIEKAHVSVVNALLQMLDEGVMRDSDSKNVSFKDAIIIATSNAGADEIRRLIDEGQEVDGAESKFVETIINRGLFAPEFINRFDEVVIFKPLTQDELVQVIDLILDDINRTLDAQKVRVELTQQAKKWLVEKGYDSKLGARPMRRMAQRYVENTIAKRLLDQSLQSGGVIKLDVSDFEASS